MQIEMVNINTLIEAEYNPRLHPDKALERLQKSIENFGFTNPVLVQKGTNIIIAGHARVKAAQKAGLEKIPIIYLDFDDTMAKAYNVADNRLAELTEWDYPALKDLITEIDTGAIDIGLTGFDELELKDLFSVDGTAGRDKWDEELQKITGELRDDYHYLIFQFEDDIDFFNQVKELFGLGKNNKTVGKDKIAEVFEKHGLLR